MFMKNKPFSTDTLFGLMNWSGCGKRKSRGQFECAIPKFTCRNLIMTRFIQDGRISGSESNMGPPECKTGVPTAHERVDSRLSCFLIWENNLESAFDCPGRTRNCLCKVFLNVQRKKKLLVLRDKLETVFAIKYAQKFRCVMQRDLCEVYRQSGKEFLLCAVEMFSASLKKQLSLASFKRDCCCNSSHTSTNCGLKNLVPEIILPG